MAPFVKIICESILLKCIKHVKNEFPAATGLTPTMYDLNIVFPYRLPFNKNAPFQSIFEYAQMHNHC